MSELNFLHIYLIVFETFHTQKPPANIIMVVLQKKLRLPNLAWNILSEPPMSVSIQYVNIFKWISENLDHIFFYIWPDVGVLSIYANSQGVLVSISIGRYDLKMHLKHVRIHY